MPLFCLSNNVPSQNMLLLEIQGQLEAEDAAANLQVGQLFQSAVQSLALILD